LNDKMFHESDPFSPIHYSYGINDILYSGKSKFQEILILDSKEFGNILVLDGVVQVTERDEFFYHEMLSHVALHAHIKPQSVLIIGGGDGGTLREVLKHESVKTVQVVELDEEVIEISKRYLPTIACGYSDVRVNVLEMDGAKFVKQTGNKFDIVLIDSTDPVGGAQVLFSEQFFNDIHSVLSEDGIMAIQTESLHFHRQFVMNIQKKLGSIFEIARLYTVPLATYAGNWWTFSIASKKYEPSIPQREYAIETKYYDDQVHTNAFLTDKLYKKLLAGDEGWW
jgi:spermidine synthase